jgi:hypothetical protein
MRDRELVRSVALEFQRRERTFEEIRHASEWKQREYLRDLIVRVLCRNGYAVPSSEWLDSVVDSFLPYLQGE